MRELEMNCRNTEQNLNRLRNALEEMKQSSDTSEEVMVRQQTAVEDLSQKVEKRRKSHTKEPEIVFRTGKNSLNNAQAQTIKATKAVNEKRSIYGRG